MVERLWMMWRDAEEQRHRIGQLWRTPEGYAFAYERSLPATFHRLAEFPEHRTADAPYRAAYLFPTFTQRIPSPRRPDYAEMLASWGVLSGDDPLEVLARSGGILVTDYFELSEWRPDDDELDAPLSVRVAGVRRHPGQASAQVGDEVTLRREPTNPRDPQATEILVASGQERLGYVPRPYTELVAGLLDRGIEVRGRIDRKLGLAETYPRWVVTLSRG